MTADKKQFTAADTLVYTYLSEATRHPDTKLELSFALAGDCYTPLTVTITSRVNGKSTIIANECELTAKSDNTNAGIVSSILLPYFTTDISAKCVITIEAPTPYQNHTKVNYTIVGVNSSVLESTTYVIRCGNVNRTRTIESCPCVADKCNKTRINTLGQLLVSHYDRAFDYLTVTDVHLASSACAIYRLLHCYTSVDFTYDNRFQAVTNVITPDSTNGDTSNLAPKPFNLLEQLQDPTLYNSIIKYLMIIRNEANADDVSLYTINRNSGTKKE